MVVAARVRFKLYGKVSMPRTSEKKGVLINAINSALDSRRHRVGTFCARQGDPLALLYDVTMFVLQRHHAI